MVKKLSQNAALLALALLQMATLVLRVRQGFDVDATRPDLSVEQRLLLPVQQLVSAADSGSANLQ